MKRLVLYTLLGLLVYVGFLIVQFPADRLLALASRHTPGLSARHIEGSAWQGSARDLSLNGTRIQSLSWRWQPRALFSGRLAFAVTMTDPQLNLHGFIGLDPSRQLRITEFKGRGALFRAVELLGGATPPWIDADLDLAVTELQLARSGRPTAAHGVIRLLKTRTSTGRELELGDFSMTFVTREHTIIGNIKDTDGPLALIGTLTLDPQGRYRFAGQVGVRDERNRELSQALNILGRPGTDGKWALDFTGGLQL